MAKYLTEDKSGIVSIVRNLKATDFETEEIHGKSLDYYTRYPSAHFANTFKFAEKLSDLEKEIMFPVSHYGNEETRYRKTVDRNGVEVSLRGVRKKDQNEKMKKAQECIDKYVKENSKKLLDEMISAMNISIMDSITKTNKSKLENLTRHYMNSSSWVWDEKEIISIDNEIKELEKKEKSLYDKRNKLQYKSALNCIETADSISEIVRDHLVEQMKSKGSLNMSMGGLRRI